MAKNWFQQYYWIKLLKIVGNYCLSKPQKEVKEQKYN